LGSIDYGLPVYDLLDPSEVDRIHDASIHILSEFGIDFYDEAAKAVLAENGAEVDGDNVRLDAGLVQENIAKAPESFTQLARNQDRNILLGNGNMVFAPVYGPPFVRDMEGVRRRGTLKDFQNFVKLAYMSPYIHHSGGTVVEVNDRPAETRHLDMIYSHLKYSDKPFMGSVSSARNASDSVKMAEILFGPDKIREKPALLSLINVSSPRRYDGRMLGVLRVYAKARQAMIITPFILAGSMGPVSIAGAIAQQNAETLAGIVLTQMIEPGTPVVYGSFITNLNLRNGMPVFGSPESQWALYVSAQLARRYSLPFRGGGMFTSSKVPDAQAAYESMNVMLPTVMAGTNFVLHAAGWLENGLVSCFSKFILDSEVLGMMSRWSKGVNVSQIELDEALESIGKVEPGGHHLATELTMSRYKEAFYFSDVFDYNNFDDWKNKGGKKVYDVGVEKAERLLECYENPDLEEDVEREIVSYIDNRKSEFFKS
jgi:trimethylamine--corrinoid protein Co-methyltransferase